MPVGKAFAAFVSDQFTGFDGVSIRPMFGGLGVFRDGAMFAMAVDDVLYFRGDDDSRPAFVAEGCDPFLYDARGKTMEMPYFMVPARLFDDEDDFRVWADRAMAAALKAKAAPKKKAPAKKNAKA